MSSPQGTDWDRMLRELRSSVNRSEQEIDSILNDAENILQTMACNYDFRNDFSYVSIPDLSRCTRNQANECKKVLYGVLAEKFSAKISQRLTEIQEETYKTILQYCEGNILPQLIIPVDFTDVLQRVLDMLRSAIWVLVGTLIGTIDFLTFRILFKEDVTHISWKNEVAGHFYAQIREREGSIKDLVMNKVKSHVEEQENKIRRERRYR